MCLLRRRERRVQEKAERRFEDSSDAMATFSMMGRHLFQLSLLTYLVNEGLDDDRNGFFLYSVGFLFNDAEGDIFYC